MTIRVTIKDESAMPSSRSPQPGLPPPPPFASV